MLILELIDATEVPVDQIERVAQQCDAVARNVEHSIDQFLRRRNDPELGDALTILARIKGVALALRERPKP